MANEFTEISYDGGTATLRLNRPPLNIMSIAMMEEVNSKLLDLRDKPDLKVLLIRGSSEAFCAGIDVAEHTKAKVGRMVQVFHRIFETIRLLEVVSIAAVEGMAMDGGFELALGCNMIVASDNARFGLPEIKLGVFPPVAAVVLPHAVPRRRAMEWILSGEEIPVAELEKHGLINRVVPADQFDEGLTKFVGNFVDKSGAVLKLAKRAQVEAYHSRWGEALYGVENLYLRELMQLKDAGEGIQAFIEKRDPKWKNS